MADSPKAPVPAGLRWGIGFLSVILTLLLIWLLGFFIDDIGDIRGPDMREFEKKHVDAGLVERAKSLGQQIEGLGRKSKRQAEIQKELRDSMNNARGTMQQMMELQKLALQQETPPSEVEKEALAKAQERFIEAQEKFETANAEISEASETRFELEREKAQVEEQIKEQQKPARAEYDEARRKHQFKLAVGKLLVIVPLFLVAAWWLVRWRRSPYRMLAVALLLATGWKLFQVMFDHFPKDFFKYIAIAAGIGTVVWFLVWLVRKATRPNRDLVLKRNREGYEKHRCPVCAYPIMRGAFKAAVWTRKGPLVSRGELVGGADEGAYSCPSCGTELYGECGKCQVVRPNLLPFCPGCGEE